MPSESPRNQLLDMLNFTKAEGFFVKILKQLTILNLVLLTHSLSHGDLKKHYFELPFEQSIQVEKVYEVTQVPQSDVAEYIKSQGVDIIVFLNPEKPEALNPAFKSLRIATEEEMKKAMLPQGAAGRLLPVRNGFNQDTIIIRADSDTYTLIHEYLHSLLFFIGDEPQAQLDETFASIERKQLFYQRKLFENPVALLNPLWRRDILDAQNGIVELVHQRIRIGQAQEAIIEKILARYIDAKNPHYSADRQKNGLMYAESMINNSITVFNNLYFAIDWNRTTVAELYRSLAAKELIIQDPKRETLTEEEAAQFKKASDEHMARIQKTMDQILLLKKMYLEF